MAVAGRGGAGRGGAGCCPVCDPPHPMLAAHRPAMTARRPTGFNITVLRPILGSPTLNILPGRVLGMVAICRRDKGVMIIGAKAKVASGTAHGLTPFVHCPNLRALRSAASGRKAAKDAVNTGRCDAFHEVARLGFEVRVLVFVLLKRLTVLTVIDNSCAPPPALHQPNGLGLSGRADPAGRRGHRAAVVLFARDAGAQQLWR